MSWMCPQCRQQVETTAHQCYHYQGSPQYQQQQVYQFYRSEKELLNEIISTLARLESKIEALEKK